MNNLEKIKEACIKANPSIMELKFGCEVKSQDKNYRYVGNGMEGIRMFSENYRGLDIATKIGDFEILGRPIRLADVLLAIGRQADKINVGGDGAFNGLKEPYMNWVKYAFWNLKDDNVDHQSEETLSFLASLLPDSK